mmetsp:Transcript_6131/g.20901  ORF Transcript_6131/g.20901 Transcript_6131/m.20901 type:complete len:202 (-) Transcript_6131:418-1023(-)
MRHHELFCAHQTRSNSDRHDYPLCVHSSCWWFRLWPSIPSAWWRRLACKCPLRCACLPSPSCTCIRVGELCCTSPRVFCCTPRGCRDYCCRPIRLSRVPLHAWWCYSWPPNFYRLSCTMPHNALAPRNPSGDALVSPASCPNVHGWFLAFQRHLHRTSLHICFIMGSQNIHLIWHSLSCLCYARHCDCFHHGVACVFPARS